MNINKTLLNNVKQEIRACLIEIQKVKDELHKTASHFDALGITIVSQNLSSMACKLDNNQSNIDNFLEFLVEDTTQ